ncbi:MAG: DNA-binding protein [bacterium]|nr:DNA-binding protein [bacterium]
MEEKDIFSQKLIVEQKKIFFDLKSTPKGDYLKITEKRNNIRNTIKIPAQGLVEFRETITKVIGFMETYNKERDPNITTGP